MATLTKEMIIDPSKITKEVRKSLKEEMKGYNYFVIFLEHKRDYGTRIVESFGYPKYEYYDNGDIAYECINAFKTIEEAIENANFIKGVTNKKFTNISVIGV